MGASFPLVFPATFEPQAAWWIDEQPIPRSVSEVATPRGLELTFRVTDQRLRDILRPLKQDEGKVDVLGTDDGGYVAVDRANGSNTYTLDPPDPRIPLRQNDTYHVARYEERAVAQTGADWEVSIEFVPDADRTDEPSISETPAAEEWGLTTRYGTIATDLDADVAGTGEGGVQRFELTGNRFTFEQAHVFEAAYSRLGAGRVRNIPDAPNVAVDDSSDGAATVTIDAPDSQNEVSDGEYVVLGWESERISDAYQRVTFTVASK